MALVFEVKEYSIDDIVEMAQNLRKYCILVECDKCKFNLPGMDCPLDFPRTGLPRDWDLDVLLEAQYRTKHPKENEK